MKDTTLVVLALIFLTLTIGSGVNKSLEEGNKMMGKEMAPEVSNVVDKYGTNTLNRLKLYSEETKTDLDNKIHNGYNRMVSVTKNVDEREIKNYLSYAKAQMYRLHIRVEQFFVSAREKVLAKKNAVDE